MTAGYDADTRSVDPFAKVTLAEGREPHSLRVVQLRGRRHRLHRRRERERGVSVISVDGRSREHLDSLVHIGRTDHAGRPMCARREKREGGRYRWSRMRVVRCCLPDQLSRSDWASEYPVTLANNALSKPLLAFDRVEVVAEPACGQLANYG